MAKHFETPVIFGVISDKSLAAPKGFARALAAKIPNTVLLPFQVEKKHLKNVIACMKIMDIAGLLVMGTHKKSIKKHLPQLNASAKKTGLVDTIIKRGRNFIGYNACELAHIGLKNRRHLMKKNQEISVKLLTERVKYKAL